MTNLYTIKELAEAKGTSWVVREALLALEAENIRLREALREVTPSPYLGESEQNKAWWAKARAILGESHD